MHNLIHPSAIGRTVGDAALDAAGAVGARPHVPALHVELVVVLAAQHRGAAEAAADLEALGIGEAEMCNLFQVQSLKAPATCCSAAIAADKANGQPKQEAMGLPIQLGCKQQAYTQAWRKHAAGYLDGRSDDWKDYSATRP